MHRFVHRTTENRDPEEQRGSPETKHHLRFSQEMEQGSWNRTLGVVVGPVGEPFDGERVKDRQTK